MTQRDGLGADNAKSSSSKVGESKPAKKGRPVVKNNSSTDELHDLNCECKQYISGELSLACENCNLYWHYCCVGLKGLTEEAGGLLEHWLCPNCFFSPYARGAKTISPSPDSPDERSIRTLIPMIQNTFWASPTVKTFQV